MLGVEINDSKINKPQPCPREIWMRESSDISTLSDLWCVNCHFRAECRRPASCQGRICKLSLEQVMGQGQKETLSVTRVELCLREDRDLQAENGSKRAAALCT